MSEIDLTIIIPIYNGAKYIEKCLDSILSQNIEEYVFEILCIDDCSTDNSVEIVEDCMKKINYLRLIKNSYNQKISNTCSIGFKHANGKYILYLSQDDWYEKTKINKVVDLCFKNQLDMLLFNFNKVDENEKIIQSVEVFCDSEIMSGKDFLFNFFDSNFHSYLLGYEWRAIFRKKHLEHNNIVFPKDVYHEDTTYLFKSIIRSQRIMSLNDFIYNYRINSNSISNENKKLRHDIVYDFHINTSKEMIEYSNTIEKDYAKYSLVLNDLAKQRVNGFTKKVVLSSFCEKRLFFNLVKGNELNSVFYMLSPLNKLLCRYPTLGLIIVTLFKPLYFLKKMC